MVNKSRPVPEVPQEIVYVLKKSKKILKNKKCHGPFKFLKILQTPHR
jgi:hypothetical protein